MADGEEENDVAERANRTYLSFDVTSKLGRTIKWLRMAGFSAEEIVTDGIESCKEDDKYKDFIQVMKEELEEV